nr:unnamed protein product [Callosobruchus analis]
MSKPLEMILKDQMLEFSLQNNIISEVQSRFRPLFSTTTALLSITDDIYKIVDGGNFVPLILLDYSKAFDTIDHDLLIKKLGFFGFMRSATRLLEHYLSERSQFVVINDVCSSCLPLRSGVPQGSILGPLLFVFYISDFNKYLKSMSVHHYADDTQMYISFNYSEFQTCHNKINKDLDILCNIFTAHNLALNASKSKVIYFGNDVVERKTLEKNR